MKFAIHALCPWTALLTVWARHVQKMLLFVWEQRGGSVRPPLGLGVSPTSCTQGTLVVELCHHL